MKVIKGKILVEPIKKTEEKIKEFLVGENKGEVNTDRGIVIQVGPEVTGVKEGDSIIFGAYARSEFDFEGKKYFVVVEDDIIVILNNK